MKIIRVMSLIAFLFFNFIFNIFEEKSVVKLNNKISIGIVDLPENLSYFSNESYVGNLFLGNLFEGLVNISSDGEIVSGIAGRYTVSDDGLVYKFYIRDDAYFSSGERITAQDFLKFFKNIIMNDKDKNYYEDLKYVDGIDEFYKGSITFDKVGFKFDKRDCFIINLREQNENFLKILSKDKFSLRNDLKYLNNYKDFYEYIDYTGAYVIDKISKVNGENLKIFLKPNKYFYLNNYKTIDQKLYSFVEDSSEIVFEVFLTREFALESYKSGKINFLFDIPYNSVSNYFNTREIYYLYNDSSNLILNLEDFRVEEESKEVFSNDLDKEEDYKIDKGNFINFIIDTREVRYINGIDGSYLQKYNFDKNYISNEFKKYNFDEKKRLKILTHSDDNYIELARNLKRFLNDEFDLSINIIALDDEQIKNKIDKGEYDILISHFVDKRAEKVLNFDKPNLILSKIGLNKSYMDGNGTIIIDSINN